MTELSAAQARRVALVAQGFAGRRSTGPVTMRHLQRVVERTRLVQMDSVNVAVRAHYLPIYSRLGNYDRNLLDRAAWRPGRGKRTLAEYWAHEAALIPIEDWPLFRWRMDEFRDGRYRYAREVMASNRSLAADILAVIDAAGPSTPRTIEAQLGIERGPQRSGGWWDRGKVKHLCEAMFAAGDLSASRDPAFGRHYDLTERVVGADAVGRRINRADAHRQLVANAGSALGVATAADLADYYRLKGVDVAPAIAELVEEEVLLPVSVHGWQHHGYLHADAAVPARPRQPTTPRGAILSPFDPLVFYRPRAERIFDFHYRIEIYVPEHKRVHGYYVHPYLLGDDLVARIDLKADRAAGVLRVPGAFLEEGYDATVVAESLAADLVDLAEWLCLNSVDIRPNGSVAPELRRLIG